MRQDHETRSLLVTRESRAPTLVAYILTLLLLVVTVGDFLGDLKTTAAFTSKSPEWRIDFEIQNETMQAVETLQDDETRNIEFDMSELSIPEGYSIGYINITITSEEDEGVSVQCDSVSGDIIENEMNAQWNDSKNTLSGQDSSCQPIYLFLSVYPDFDGASRTVSALNEYQALESWKEVGWGDGILSLDLDLDVNAPFGFDPVGQDVDEEITVDVSVVMFSVSIQEI